MKTAIISVTNDLSTDKRVNKTALVLDKLGFDVLLIGRRLKLEAGSWKLEAGNHRPYKTKLFRLAFNKGPLFYAEYNMRLFFFLLFHKSDLLVANDLDTLPANYLAIKFKNKFKKSTVHSLQTTEIIQKSTVHSLQTTDLVYDCHEYFTGVPELAHRRLVRNIWKAIEKKCFPELEDIITVNDSIAKLYNNEYGKELQVVRNITPECRLEKKKTREDLGLPLNKRIIILQGSGINIDRGAEEAVEAMQYVQKAVLLIIGNGDVIPILREMINELYLQEKVIYIPSLPFEELMQYTLNADLGLSLDKDTNINYKFSLPNKLFDYIHAGIPVLASPLVEIKKIIDKYQIGDTIANHDPRHIASKISCMLDAKDKIDMWKKNLKIAAADLCWEKEEKKLLEIFRKYV